MTDEQFYNHPPVKPGYIRIYEDHTGRWYKDYTQEELDNLGTPEEKELFNILKENIRQELDDQLVERIKKFAADHQVVSTKYVPANFNPEGIIEELELLIRRALTTEELQYLDEMIEYVDKNERHYSGLDCLMDVHMRCKEKFGWVFLDPREK